MASAESNAAIMGKPPRTNALQLIDRLVNFRVRDVYMPDPREILDELYGNDILQGKVLDLTDSGATKQVFAVVEVESVSRHVIVPMERILDVL